VNQSRLTSTGVRLALGCSLSIILWLANNALISSKCIDDSRMGCVNKSFYTSPAAIHDRRLDALIQQKSKTLELIVWGSDRRILSHEISDLLHQRINFNPLNGKLWLQLTYFQKDAGISIADRAWVIARARKLTKWNLFSRSQLSHYCIVEYEKFQSVSPRLCSDLIANLPESWSNHTKAFHAQVNHDEFLAVLKLEKNKFNGVSE
jgi:hypothetical protein